jgi:hypothetical protein
MRCALNARLERDCPTWLAQHISEAGPRGRVLIDGLFLNNTAREYGWGSRAGAVRLQYIATNVCGRLSPLALRTLQRDMQRLPLPHR